MAGMAPSPHHCCNPCPKPGCGSNQVPCARAEAGEQRRAHLPGSVLVAEAGPLDEDLPAGAAGGGAARDQALGRAPGALGQAAGGAPVPPLEVGQLALGQAPKRALGHPLVVAVRLARPLDQVLRLLGRLCACGGRARTRQKGCSSCACCPQNILLQLNVWETCMTAS